MAEKAKPIESKLQSAKIDYLFVIRLLSWLAIISLSYFFLNEIVEYVVSLLKFPFDWDPYEGFAINAANRIRAGESPYNNPFTYPFLTYLYTPLYPSLVALIGKGSISDLATARIISLISFLLLLVTIYFLSRKTGLDKELAVIPSILVLTNVDVAIWIPFARVDCLCVALTVGGIFFSVRTFKGHPKDWILSTSLMFLATMTKHVTLPLFAFYIIYGLIKKEVRKHAMIFSAFIFLFITLIFIAFGGNMINSLVSSGIKEMDFSRSCLFFFESFKQYPIIFTGFIGVTFFLKRNLLFFNPVSIFFLFCLLFFILASHTGSAVNYMIWPVIAFSIGLAYLSRSFKNMRFAKVFVLVLVACHLLISKSSFSLKKPTSEHKQVNESIVEFLKFSLADPLVDELPMLSFHAGFTPLIDTEGARALIWKKHGKDGWKTMLLNLILSGPKYEIILAGPKLGSLYPELMEGYIPVGDVEYNTWFGRQRLIGFIRPDLKTKVNEACMKTTKAVFYCNTLRGH